jgi:hypothetical protein
LLVLGFLHFADNNCLSFNILGILNIEDLLVLSNINEVVTLVLEDLEPL